MLRPQHRDNAQNVGESTQYDDGGCACGQSRLRPAGLRGGPPQVSVTATHPSGQRRAEDLQKKTAQGRWAPGRGSGTPPLFRVCLPPGGFAGLGGACMQSTAARPHGQTGRLVRAPLTARVPQTGHPTAASPPGGSTWPNGRACNSGLDPGPQPEGCSS